MNVNTKAYGFGFDYVFFHPDRVQLDFCGRLPTSRYPKLNIGYGRAKHRVKFIQMFPCRGATARTWRVIFYPYRISRVYGYCAPAYKRHMFHKAGIILRIICPAL
jgi:hypothetical protein